MTVSIRSPHRAPVEQGREDVVPPQDHEAREMGVAEIFGPGTELTGAALRVLDAIEAS